MNSPTASIATLRIRAATLALLGAYLLLSAPGWTSVTTGRGRYTLNTQIALLARRGRLLPWLASALIWLVFKRERNLPVD